MLPQQAVPSSGDRKCPRALGSAQRLPSPCGPSVKVKVQRSQVHGHLPCFGHGAEQRGMWSLQCAFPNEKGRYRPSPVARR